jgi:hypothetical protein
MPVTVLRTHDGCTYTRAALFPDEQTMPGHVLALPSGPATPIAPACAPVHGFGNSVGGHIFHALFLVECVARAVFHMLAGRRNSRLLNPATSMRPFALVLRIVTVSVSGPRMQRLKG